MSKSRKEQIYMKEFDVKITETLERTVTVNAVSQEEAEIMVHDQHSQGDHVLDVNDYTGVDFQTIAEREKQLNVLLVEPMKPPTEITIPDTLQSLQETLGGKIETLNPFDDPVVIIGTNEAKLHNLQLNRGLNDEKGELQDIICGKFIVAGVGEETFESLSPEQMVKYKDHFEKPEKFYSLAGTIIAQKVEPPKDKDLMKKATQPER